MTNSAAALLTADQIEALRQIDTPTICNAIESFNVRGRVEGFCGMDSRCLSPQLGVMVGHAHIVNNIAGCTEETRAGSSFAQYRRTCAVSWAMRADRSAAASDDHARDET